MVRKSVYLMVYVDCEGRTKYMSSKKNNKKTIIIISIIVLVLVTIFVVQKVTRKDISELTYEETTAKDYDYYEEDGEIILKEYKGNKESIKIPEEIDGKKVVGLKCDEKKVFATDLRAVYIPKTIEKMGNNKSVEDTKGGFFSDFIEKIEVDPKNEKFLSDNGVLYRINKENKKECFLLLYPRSKSDEEYKLRDNTAKICDCAFEHNVYIKRVICNDKLEKICKSAFYECERLEDIQIQKDSVKFIGKFAFIYTGLKKIELPECLEGMGTSVEKWEEDNKKYNENTSHAWIFDSSITLLVKKDSPAYKYAKKKEYKYETY